MRAFPEPTPEAARLARVDRALLERLARRYVWWKSPAEASAFPQHVLAQVMDVGTIEDLVVLWHEVDDDTLREVLVNAEAGQFRPRSWHYWHYRLGMADTEEGIPPLPARRIP